MLCGNPRSMSVPGPLPRPPRSIEEPGWGERQRDCGCSRRHHPGVPGFTPRPTFPPAGRIPPRTEEGRRPCTLRTPMWLALGVVLAVVCVLLVARPFLREPEPLDDRLGEPGQEEEARIALAEERDRALAALKELEFDHRTGKVSDEDYRELVGPLRRRAAETLRALEPRSREAEAGGRVRAAS